MERYVLRFSRWFKINTDTASLQEKAPEKLFFGVFYFIAGPFQLGDCFR